MVRNRGKSPKRKLTEEPVLQKNNALIPPPPPPPPPPRRNNTPIKNDFNDNEPIVKRNDFLLNLQTSATKLKKVNHEQQKSENALRKKEPALHQLIQERRQFIYDTNDELPDSEEMSDFDDW